MRCFLFFLGQPDSACGVIGCSKKIEESVQINTLRFVKSCYKLKKQCFVFVFCSFTPCTPSELDLCAREEENYADGLKVPTIKDKPRSSPTPKAMANLLRGEYLDPKTLVQFLSIESFECLIFLLTFFQDSKLYEEELKYLHFKDSNLPDLRRKMEMRQLLQKMDKEMADPSRLEESITDVYMEVKALGASLRRKFEFFSRLDLKLNNNFCCRYVELGKHPAVWRLLRTGEGEETWMLPPVLP